MRVLKTVCVAAALTTLLAPGVRADGNKKTILTFSGPVQIPGATLPAGSYVFKLADLSSNRHVVQVFDKDEKKIYTTILAIPNQRLDASDKPVVLFSERTSGSPQAVKVWYYPGETIGNEFVYPKTQAMRIAKETHQSVLSTNDETPTLTSDADRTSSMKSAKLGRFDQAGTWQNDDRDAAAFPAPSSTATSSQAVAGPARTTGQRRAAAAAATGTSGRRSTRNHLPQTASNLALFELMSGFCIAGGLALRHFGKRIA
jgi:hypothetical protein